MDTNNQVFEKEKTAQTLSKPLFSLTAGDTAFAISALVVCVFLSLFGIFSGFAFGYFLSATLMIIMFTAYFLAGGKVRFLSVLCGLLSLGINVIFICTTNGSVRFFGVIIGLLLSLVCFDGLVNGTAKGNRQTLGIFYSAASAFGNIAVTLKSIFTGKNGNKKVIGKVLIGLLCAIPVLIVVLPLLISSDDAFRGMMSSIFDNTFLFILKFIIGIAICPIIISYGFSLKSGRVSKIKNSNFKGIENVYLVSFLSAISLCYVLYLFSQLAYFFSAFRGFLPDGEITYAQYARKGFFEMCVIAVINLVIVFSALLLAKKKNGKVSHSIKAITTFISLFTMIIIATAISKMVLYIDAYGMTILRITTSAFMIFLSIVFISVILRIYIKKINIVKTALITAGSIVLILGIFNVNSVCARYNYESYENGKLRTIDIEALYDLGEEGIPYLVKLADSKEKEIAQVAKRYLAAAYLYGYFDDMYDAESFTVDDLKKNQEGKGFEHFSIPKSKAYNELYKYIENNPQFSSECQGYITELENSY